MQNQNAVDTEVKMLELPKGRLARMPESEGQNGAADVVDGPREQKAVGASILEQKLTKITKGESWVEGGGGSGREKSGAFRPRVAALARRATTENG